MEISTKAVNEVAALQKVVQELVARTADQPSGQLMRAAWAAERAMRGLQVQSGAHSSVTLIVDAATRANGIVRNATAGAATTLGTATSTMGQSCDAQTRHRVTANQRPKVPKVPKNDFEKSCWPRCLTPRISPHAPRVRRDAPHAPQVQPAPADTLSASFWHHFSPARALVVVFGALDSSGRCACAVPAQRTQKGTAGNRTRDLLDPNEESCH